MALNTKFKEIQFVALVLFCFFLGMYYYAYEEQSYYYLEGMEEKHRCPDMLVQKDKEFYLFNSKLNYVPGVNPIKFNNLEEYTEFMEWQKSQGIECPVLHLQQYYDIQGKFSYENNPFIKNVIHGANSNNNDPNEFEEEFAYPQLNKCNKTISANAMHSNWGGINYTSELIEKGYFKQNEVTM